MEKMIVAKCMLVVTLLAACMASCSSDNDTAGGKEPAALQPAVSLTAGTPTATSLTFTVESQHATECAYFCIKKGETVPSAETVLSSGTKVTVNKRVEATVDKLEAATAYQIVAAARGEEETTVTKTLEMQTAEAPQVASSHTLVFYFMGNETGLESEMDANVQKVVTAVIGNQLVDDNHHVAIFYDRGNYCRLTQVARAEDGRTKQITIEEYALSQSCVDPQFMAGVLAKVREVMPADTYGLVLSSHGGGWVPAEIYDLYLAAARTRFLGQDGDDYMEMPQLAEGLKEMHFDYILMDACFMASVEGLYDLRGVTDYVVSSPAEVLGGGFPYTEILPLLFKDGHDLPGVCRAFMNTYGSTSGTISLIQCSALESLASAMKKVLARSAGKAIDTANIQGYEGFSPHLYFDLEQYVEALTADEALRVEFKTALQQAVIYHDYTKTFYSAVGPGKGYISLPRSCGLTCHVKESKFPETHAAFLETDWAKAVDAD